MIIDPDTDRVCTGRVCTDRVWDSAASRWLDLARGLRALQLLQLTPNEPPAPAGGADCACS